MGNGKIAEVNIDGTHVSVRDYGRDIPLSKLRTVPPKSNGRETDSEL